MNTEPMLREDRGGKDGCGLDLELVLQSDRGKFRMGRKKPSRKKQEVVVPIRTRETLGHPEPLVLNGGNGWRYNIKTFVQVGDKVRIPKHSKE